jgi:hypothetical protein
MVSFSLFEKENAESDQNLKNVYRTKKGEAGNKNHF